MGKAREHVEKGVELWNNGDLDNMRTRWAADGVEVSPLGTLTGVDAIVDGYRLNLIAFPNRRVTALSWVEDGDTVVVEGEWSGTHSGPLTLPHGSEVPPTGHQLMFRLVAVFEVRDAKTVSHRIYFDQLPVMMQLGLVAPAQQP